MRRMRIAWWLPKDSDTLSQYTYCFCTVTVVARNRLIFRLYFHFLSYCKLNLSLFLIMQYAMMAHEGVEMFFSSSTKRQLLVCQDLLIIEASRSHQDTPHSVGCRDLTKYSTHQIIHVLGLIRNCSPISRRWRLAPPPPPPRNCPAGH